VQPLAIVVSPVRSNDFRDFVVVVVMAEPPLLASASASVHIYGDCDPIHGVPPVVQVIAIFRVNDIDIIVFVPVVRPVLWPWVHETEPKTGVPEARVPAIYFDRVCVDAEPVIRTKVAAIVLIRNAVAAVTTTFPPVAVFGPPVTGAMLLPHFPVLTLLYTLPLL